MPDLANSQKGEPHIKSLRLPAPPRTRQVMCVSVGRGYESYSTGLPPLLGEGLSAGSYT